MDIGDNENPFGPSPMAVRAVAERLLDVNRYDFGATRKVADAAGRHHGFPEPPPPAHRFAESGYPVYVEGGSSFILRLVAEHYGVRDGSGESSRPIRPMGASRALSRVSRPRRC